MHAYLNVDQKDLAKIIQQKQIDSNLNETVVEPEIVTLSEDSSKKEETNEKNESKAARKSADKGYAEYFERFERRSTRLSSKALSVNEDDRKSVKNTSKCEKYNEEADDEDASKEESEKHLAWFYNLNDEINYSIDDLFLVKI